METVLKRESVGKHEIELKQNQFGFSVEEKGKVILVDNIKTAERCFSKCIEESVRKRNNVDPSVDTEATEQ